MPWTAQSSNQAILKDINPEYSLEGLMLKLKLQYFGHLMLTVVIGKDSDSGKGGGTEISFHYGILRIQMGREVW